MDFTTARWHRAGVYYCEVTLRWSLLLWGDMEMEFATVGWHRDGVCYCGVTLRWSLLLWGDIEMEFATVGDIEMKFGWRRDVVFGRIRPIECPHHTSWDCYRGVTSRWSFVPRGNSEMDITIVGGIEVEFAAAGWHQNEVWYHGVTLKWSLLYGWHWNKVCYHWVRSNGYYYYGVKWSYCSGVTSKCYVRKRVNFVRDSCTPTNQLIHQQTPHIPHILLHTQTNTSSSSHYSCINVIFHQ